LKYGRIVSEWMIVAERQVSNSTAISWLEEGIFQRVNGDIRFVLI
jgi:hypothetical protein